MFLFSSSEKIQTGEPIILPEDMASLDLIMKTALAVGSGALGDDQAIEIIKESRQVSRWDLVRSDPFCLMIPAKLGLSLERALVEAETKSPFCLIPLSTSPRNSAVLVDCLNQGFIPCGFDRNLSEDGHPVLLLGRLREGTLLAPIRLVSGLFGVNVISGIDAIDRSFRSRLISKI